MNAENSKEIKCNWCSIRSNRIIFSENDRVQINQTHLWYFNERQDLTNAIGRRLRRICPSSNFGPHLRDTVITFIITIPTDIAFARRILIEIVRSFRVIPKNSLARLLQRAVYGPCGIWAILILKICPWLTETPFSACSRVTVIKVQITSGWNVSQFIYLINNPGISIKQSL